ncbi:MAG: hypothetical protein M1817_005189 [Caeruleum heppii]|nr:MAG: hypothetical protein M1817_005189 [Caeruleum heppii]
MTPISPSSSPLHLLRALLRQCTYLPDPQSRLYLRHHILSRFRLNRFRGPKFSASFTPAPSAEPAPPRLRTALKDARKSLSLLIRANAGYPRALLKTLIYTYGRSGKRRHELLRPLLLPDTPSSHADVAEQAARQPSSTSRNPLDHSSDLRNWPAISSQLRALMRSQRDQPHLSRTSRGPRLKHIVPQIPKENIWKRPLPKKREKNLRWKFYAETLDRLCAPLPEEEWSYLYSVVHGTIPPSMPVPRRVALKPAEAVPPTLLTASQLSLTGQSPLAAPKSPLPSGHRERPHNFTTRSMRRLYGVIFAESPRMRWDGSQGKWLVEWGHGFPSGGKGVRTPVGEVELGLFGGVVDESGRMPRPDSIRTSRKMQKNNDAESSSRVP